MENIEIYNNCFYDVWIKKNTKNDKNKYIGFLGKKVVFLHKDLKMPFYLKEGRFNVEGKCLKDMGNYFILTNWKFPSMYDVMGIDKKAFKNTNTTEYMINGTQVKVAKNYIEIRTNSTMCRLSLFQRGGNYRDVDMTLINVGGHLRILNDCTVFGKNGLLPEEYLHDVVSILSMNVCLKTKLFLISEYFWIDTDLFKNTLKGIKEEEGYYDPKEDKVGKNIIEELNNDCAYGAWDGVGTYNLNIPIANKILYNLIR